MATKKAQAPKTITLVKKQPVLTEDQLETLKDVEFSLGEIRRKLANLEDEETLTKVMFNIGMIFKIVDIAEDKLSEFVYGFEKDEDNDDDINF
jgi:hypothetical protein